MPFLCSSIRKLLCCNASIFRVGRRSQLPRPRPPERLLEAIIAPEKLTIRGCETRCAENAKRLRLFRILAQGAFHRRVAAHVPKTCRLERRRSQAARQHIVIGDVGTFSEGGAEDSAAELRRPAEALGGNCEPSGLEAMTRKCLRHPEREAARRRDALNISHHVAAFGGINIEGRRRPPLRHEDRPEQERSPFYGDAGTFTLRVDPHCGEVGVGRGKLVPEDNGGLHRTPPFS